ncbi:flagellar basal-body MS-ring/collar protein FliF [uncultured Jatrophihabitans sp.]|uniref:flagellar basal-body MS-ring/collar protein FliF n=1 Tax=uncultured Jatrophihabitans sp. TaxID=1610747 RepID=UPI0035C9C59D
MKDRLQALGMRRWNDFRAFTPGQKLVTVVAVLALVIGGYLLATWRPAPKYAPLYSNLATSDASAIVSKLDADKIPYQLSGGGTTISVPADKVDSTRLTMSAANLPGSGQTGYALLDKEGVTTSQFKQQIDYQRAVEGELAQTIESIDGVKAASVHLSIPQQDVFNDNTQKPSAAVLLSVDPGTTLDDSQVQSVAYLVSSSVPGLSTNAVAITDSNGTVLRAPGGATGNGVSADTQAKATQSYDSSLAQSMQAMLDKALGPNRSAVTVNADLDFDQTKSTKRSYINDPTVPPVSESKSSQIYKGANAASGGTAGSTTTDTTGTATNSGGGTMTQTNDTVNNADGTVTQTTENAPGSVRRLSIAVMLDKNTPNLDVPAMQDLLQNSAGFDQTRGDTISVQTVPFDHSAAATATKAGAAAAKAAASAAAHQRLISWIKQGVLVLLIAGLLIGAVLWSRRRNPPPAEPDDDVFGLDEPDDPVEPPVVALPVKSISSNRHRHAIVEAAGERPQDVARALSNWINTKESDR